MANYSERRSSPLLTMTWMSFQVLSSPKGDAARILSSYSLTVSNFKISSRDCSDFDLVIFVNGVGGHIYSSVLFDSSGDVSGLSPFVSSVTLIAFGSVVTKLYEFRELSASSYLFSL